MDTLPEVIRIEYAGGRVYRVWFDNGVSGEVDFSDYLGRGPVFEAFRDLETFRQATVAFGTMSWPGDIDIAPEAIYERLTSAVRSP